MADAVPPPAGGNCILVCKSHAIRRVQLQAGIKGAVLPVQQAGAAAC
jgi:hypothetical protein